MMQNRNSIRIRGNENRKESKDSPANRSKNARASILLHKASVVKAVNEGRHFIRGSFANMQELVRTREIRQQPAHEVNLPQEVMSGGPVHLILAYLIVREYETPKLSVVLQNIGVWTGMLLFSMSFYYGLVRLVMWASSL
jgi:hypothetical protein